MSKEELKPCPFCGGTDLVIDDGDGTDYSWKAWIHIWCKKCEGSGPYAVPDDNVAQDKRYKATEAEAVRLWNRREEG